MMETLTYFDELTSKLFPCASSEGVSSHEINEFWVKVAPAPPPILTPTLVVGAKPITAPRVVDVVVGAGVVDVVVIDGAFVKISLEEVVVTPLLEEADAEVGVTFVVEVPLVPVAYL